MRTFQSLAVIVMFAVLSRTAAKQKWFKTENNRDYYIEQDYAFTWFEALLQCSFRNMSLLTLETIDKHDDIAKILIKDDFKFNAPHLWIGAAGHLRQFSWISNSKAVHTSKWIPGNPDNWNSEEHCIHFWENTTLLNDRKCDHKYGFICEPKLSDASNESHNFKYKQIVLNF